MHLKPLLTTALLFIGGVTIATAQDQIYLRNGRMIEGKVVEVTTRKISYTEKGNPDGPSFVLGVREVSRIHYANGSSDEWEPGRREMSREGAPRSHSWFSNEKYGKNILSIAPIQMANEGAAGVGIHYERVVDKNNIVSITLPYALNFRRYQHYDGNEYVTNRAFFHYFYPGIKIYPSGSNRRVSYAVGASAAIGFGQKYYNYYTPNNGYVYGGRDVLKAGLLFNNSLNIQPTKHLFVGVELGLGFTYYDEASDNNNYYDSNNEPLVQFNFKVGYRF